MVDQAPNNASNEQAQQPVLDDPLAKDLWAFASKKMTQSKQQAKSLIFVGEKQCGKSSLINKFLELTVKDEMAETTALEFKSGLKLQGDKKVKTNVYELGGGRNFANLLEAAFCGGNIANTTVCIVLDLTKPGITVASLLFWLNAVKEQAQIALEALQQSNPTQLSQMQQAMREKWGNHEDRDRLNLCPVPIAVIGAKFDAFANQYDTQLKKQLCMALRYVAQSSGCDLVFGSIKEKLPSQLYRSLLMSHLFEGSTPSSPEMNPANALNIRAGQDSLSRIDEPEGAGQRRGSSMESLWQEVIERAFPKHAELQAQAAQKLLSGLTKFTEEKVDQMRKQKDEELEQYIKQTLRAKRFETKNAQATGGQNMNVAEQSQGRGQRQQMQQMTTPNQTDGGQRQQQQRFQQMPQQRRAR